MLAALIIVFREVFNAVSLPKILSDLDSHRKAESSHH
jgi:hypothetical protein